VRDDAPESTTMSQPTPATQIESGYAWTRLWVSLVLMTIGGSGNYSVSVVLPEIQAEFHAGRGDAAIPYTLAMIGFGLGGVLMGRLSDRFGVALPAAPCARAETKSAGAGRLSTTISGSITATQKTPMPT
jgi:MFS family permease